MLTDRDVWRDQAEVLSGLTAVDVIELPDAGSIEACAAEILDSAPDRFALAGLSLGGMVAIEMAAQAPERVERLALFDTSSREPTQQQRDGWQQLAKAATAEGPRAVAGTLMELLLAPSPDYGEQSDRVLAMSERVGTDGFLGHLRLQQSRSAAAARLKKISCPALVVRGASDAMCSLEMHQEISEGLGGAPVVEISAAGHLSPIEAPAAVSALLSYWIQGAA